MLIEKVPLDLKGASCGIFFPKITRLIVVKTIAVRVQKIETFTIRIFIELMTSFYGNLDLNLTYVM